MTTACLHERIDFELTGGAWFCLSCPARGKVADGICKKCLRALDDKPHFGAMACA